MELLRCKLCHGEMDIINSERSVNKKVQCRQCGFNNLETLEKRGPEVIVIRKRVPNQD